MADQTVTRPEQTGIPVVHDVDVIVVGGGPGGIGAAVAAARQGARTLLCEQYGFLGGMASAGLVNPFMPNGKDGRRFDSGIHEEWVNLMKEMGGAGGSRGDTICHETAKLAAEVLCKGASVELLYHVVLDRPLMDGAAIDCVLMLGKSGLTAHRAKVFVDTTGDADLAARAGCTIEYGRAEDGGTQPMTLSFDVAGIDLDRVEWGEVNRLYDKAREEGRLTCPRENVLHFRTLEGDRIHFNTTRIVGRDATDTLSLSEAEIEGRRQVMDYMAFFRRDLAGFENCRLHAMGANIGVRESRRVRGQAYVTRDDYRRCAKYPDSICRVNYNIDIHNPAGGGTEHERLPEGEWYEIPYGCVVPLGVDNLLVGGRPISVDHGVHSSMRVMPPANTIGQACGTAAAMAVAQGLLPRDVDGVAVHNSLVEQGVWLEERE